MGFFGKVNSVLVVDTAAVLKTKGVRGNALPRQQLQVLRALSRFAQREKLSVTAVLVGAPLDKAPHNHVFEDVRVRYAKSDDVLKKELLSALKQAGSGGVLVTENVELESLVIRGGAGTLRVSTFRKLLDDGNEQSENKTNNSGGNNKNNRTSRNNNRRERDRSPRNNNRNGNQQSKPQSKPQVTPDDAVTEERVDRNKDVISQMIDLVD